MSPETATAHAGAGAGTHGDAHEEPHLPHGSVWPFWLAIGFALIGLGAIFPGVMTVVGLVALLIPIIGWLREDHRWWWHNIGTGLHVPRAGTLLFIGSEIFLFGALFATYFTFKAQTAGPWPDPNAHGHVVHLPVLTVLVFSVFLFSSSFTIHKAEHHLKRGEHKRFRNWWLATILLGAVFLAGQVSEYITLISEQQTLGGGSQFMTAFFLLTGTHGAHVFGGLVALIIVYIRASKGQFTAERHAAPESVSLYWHFVDIVWVVVLSVLYLIPTFT